MHPAKGAPFDVQVPFLAPVPCGNEVLVARLKRDASAVEHRWLVHDRTAGVVYCDHHLEGPLGRALGATEDPIAALTRWTWVVDVAVVGQAVGAIAISSDVGDANVAKTTLFVVETSPAPYR